MKVTISARHFDASDKLQKFATDEIAILKKYFDGVLHADVILAENGAMKEVEIRVTMLGKVITSKLDGDDFHKLIPKVVDKLEQQVKKLKSKTLDR